MKITPFDYKLPDFDRFTNDQQFINVVDALTIIETQHGGLTPEEIWEQAINLLESLKSVSRPEITVKRMFYYVVDELKGQLQGRSQHQIEHTAYCILFCAAYILCANDDDPDPNQDIIDSLCSMLVKMEDIVQLFNAVEQMEDVQEAKGYIVKPHNVLAKPHDETAEEAAQRILEALRQDIISPIVSANFVQPFYKAEFEMIWKDILADETMLELMRREEFGKTYNLKLVVNILALMAFDVLTASPNKLNNLLFTGSGHYKYFTKKTSGNFSAFNSSSEQAIVKIIIEKHKK